jgi:hypothetical protein
MLRRTCFCLAAVLFSLSAAAADKIGSIHTHGNLLTDSVQTSGYAYGTIFGIVSGATARHVQENFFWFTIDSDGVRYLLGPAMDHGQPMNHLPEPFLDGGNVKFNYWAGNHKMVWMQVDGEGKHKKIALRVGGCHPLKQEDDEHWYDCPK